MSSGSSMPVWMMANSSPPTRATVSVSRTQWRSRAGHHLEQLVADRMAERVVDALEAVEIEIEHRELVAAADAGQRLGEPLAEQHAVGQIGQRVVARHMRDLLLGALALGDVVVGGDPAAVGSSDG